jgi:hypothetical protein
LRPDERERLEQLAKRFVPEERNVLSEFVDSTFVAEFVVRLVHQRLQKLGVYDAILSLPWFENARVMLSAVESTASVPADLWTRARTWWERFVR